MESSDWRLTASHHRTFGQIRHRRERAHSVDLCPVGVSQQDSYSGSADITGYPDPRPGFSSSDLEWEVSERDPRRNSRKTLFCEHVGICLWGFDGELFHQPVLGNPGGFSGHYGAPARLCRLGYSSTNQPCPERIGAPVAARVHDCGLSLPNRLHLVYDLGILRRHTLSR